MLFQKRKRTPCYSETITKACVDLRQDSPCQVFLENENVIFKKQKPMVMVTFPIKQEFQSIDFIAKNTTLWGCIITLP